MRHPRENFRQRFDERERQRALLISRLSALGEKAATHPGHKRALPLFNATFRKSSVAQRLAVLQATSWLVFPHETMDRDITRM